MTDLRPTEKQIAAIMSAISAYIQNDEKIGHETMLSAWRLSTLDISNKASNYRSLGWTRRN